MRTPTVAETFDQHYLIDECTGCFVWQRALKGPAPNNYGHLRAHGRLTTAHRFAYERRHGEGSADGLQVLHKCNNPQCVNPSHLKLGTMLENQAQKARDLRAGKKLTPLKVRAIRAELAKGRPQHAVARQFGVCQMNVSFIARRVIWPHA